MAVAQEQRNHAQVETGELVAEELQRVFLMLNSFETGGSERQFAALAKSLDPNRFAINLGCIQTKGPLRDLFGEVPRFKLGGSVYGWKSWHSRWRLARHLRQKRIQIAHGFDFYTNLTLVPAALAARVPVIIGSQRQLGDLLTPAQRKLQMAAFRACDAVVCNSQAAAGRLVSDGLSQSKIRVIGNALAHEAFASTEPLVPRKAGALRLGMIARMNSEAKNHRIFLLAAAKLHASFPEAEFLLAGDGPLRSKLQTQAAALGIGDCVRFLGDRRDIPAVMASLDLTVVPSDSESLSNVILESMAAGVPVVATDVGGNPELLGENRGVLVPSRDVDALSDALTRLLQDEPARRQFSAASKKFAVSHFSAESVTREYENFYEELLERKNNSSVSRRQPASSHKIQVAVIGPSLNYVGGQSVQLDLLLRHWQDSPDIEMSFIPVDPAFPPGLGWVQRIPGLRTIVRTPFYLAGLWRGLREKDVAHIFSASYSSFLVAPVPAVAISKLQGVKTVVHYHSGEARDHLRRSRFARTVLRRVDRIVTPSAYLVDVFRQFGLQAEPIANIIDVSQFQFRERKPVRPHLVCTRGFHPYYCIDVVVRAFALIKKTFPEAMLDLVGGGPLEPEIRALTKELSVDGVDFCGVARRGEIGVYYDRADIFVNASRLDNMPVSVLEAYAAGLPVVTTGPAGMDYLVHHERTGLLSPVGDPELLAANIVRVLQDQKLAAQLIAGGLEQMNQYRWSVVEGEWLKLYRELSAVVEPSIQAAG